MYATMVIPFGRSILIAAGAIALLSGCDDKGATLARCRIDNERQVSLCMRAAGYVGYVGHPHCRAIFDPDEEGCYHASGWLGDAWFSLVTIHLARQ